MISLKDFSLGFDSKVLLQNVSTEFKGERLMAIIGKNGSGKSTLLKAMAGLNKNYCGEITINGVNLRKIPLKDLASKISFVNTSRPRMQNLKCIDIVRLGRSPFTGWHGALSDIDEIMVKRAIETVGMTEYSLRYFNTLSDGESQKIMIARAIAQNTEIILLDEPTSFLDLPTRNELVALLKYLCEDEKKTIIFSTHELDIALKYSDEIALFDSPHLVTLPSSQLYDYLVSTSHPFAKYL